MMYPLKYSLILILILCCACLTACSSFPNTAHWQWETLPALGEPIARHEAGFVAYKEKLYLIGGRRINATSAFDTNTQTWVSKSATPIELHHFQPVVLNDAIYIVGAMTGEWPHEKPLDKVIIYYPDRDEYVYSHRIPKHRRRGGAGAVVYNNKIYVVGGITNGHMNGYTTWLDEYDPIHGTWKPLADAPNARDHFHAVMHKNKLYAFAGRTTSKATNQDMALTTTHGNIYNMDRNTWEPVTTDLAIPTERAGNFAFAWHNDIIVGGGESVKQEMAHNEVDVFNTEARTWTTWPSLNQGRHGTGFAVVGDYVYTASGSGKRGGTPELTTIERLQLPQSAAKNGQSATSPEKAEKRVPVFSQWHTMTLSFNGPDTSESALENPFLHYRLLVDFTHKETQKTVRGFYAADGYAAHTSASSGPVWQVRFTPNKTGEWSYSAQLHTAENIALDDNMDNGESIPLEHPQGTFFVVNSDKEGDDFRSKGPLGTSNGFFKFTETDAYWLKAGTNSPENLLGYTDFDDTYRIKAEAREGEATAPKEIHSFAPHLQDWKTGDPLWKKDKGKSLIGAINYLASKGMNTAYFLTLNILGDGKDVWPYVEPTDFTRFDVSKLDQWEILFQHMQAKGILLHMVLQETENETMLDSGDTGPLRQLYFREMIARFGHHLALVWNLGEENGPAPWVPIGQNDQQRKAMTTFLKKTDPYNHPVLLHTHAEDPLRENILNDIVGFPKLDGLSLQQADRAHAGPTVEKWKRIAAEANHPWLITMDEIGKWHTAALPDQQDPGHRSLRGDVLWGSLLSGAAGIEWYFGAKHPHNDLTSEDWRQRDQLWELTHYAKEFFNRFLPYWNMTPNHTLVNTKKAYCLQKPGELYAVYLPDSKTYTLDLRGVQDATFTVRWFNPLQGGALQKGTVSKISSGGVRRLGLPPANAVPGQDWVALVELNRVPTTH